MKRRCWPLLKLLVSGDRIFLADFCSVNGLANFEVPPRAAYHHSHMLHWLPMIVRYDYEIKYKKGVDNKRTDALPLITKFEFHAISPPNPNW